MADKPNHGKTLLASSDSSHSHGKTDGKTQLCRCVPWVRTCACHFLQKPPAPLKVGTPLSALTPAPVMMAMCFALAKTSRKSAISGHGGEGWTAAQTLKCLQKRPYRQCWQQASRNGFCMHLPGLQFPNTIFFWVSVYWILTGISWRASKIWEQTQ